MPSVLVTPPAVEPVTLAEAKAHLRINHADEDVVINTLIASSRRIVEARSGLMLIAQGWTCYLDDWPDDGVISLPLAPVSSVDDLAVFGEDDVASVIDPAHYYADTVSRPPRLVLRGSRAWAKSGRIVNGIAVEVTVGFGPTGADVPGPLRQAMLQLTAHWFEHRGNANPPPMPLTIEAAIRPFRELRV